MRYDTTSERRLTFGAAACLGTAALCFGAALLPGGASAHHTPCQGGISVYLSQTGPAQVHTNTFGWNCAPGLVQIHREPAAAAEAPPEPATPATAPKPKSKAAKRARCRKAKSQKKNTRQARRCKGTPRRR